MRATGLLQVYTGDGKGKTTAAVGLAVRARSRGLRVLFAQFMKPAAGGEPDALAAMGVEVLRFSRIKSPLFNPGLDPEAQAREVSAAMGGLSALMPEFDLMVLDEFVHVINTSEAAADEARAFIEARPVQLEMVLTGRGAPGWLLEMADLATEMRVLKHPASGGLPARKGIEF
jgi:cob(I)alamin adenosyltransferase